MTTIESFPAETITQILKEASHLEFEQDNFSLPVTLLQCIKVSRRWHSIALQTPDLYTNIVIPFNTLQERNCSILKWTKFWFDQSRPCTVTVTVHLSTGESGLRGRQILRQILLDYIIPHSFRLRAFHFICPDIKLPAFLNSAVDAPKLEELVIHTAVDGAIFLDPYRHIFRSTPNLRKIVLHGTPPTTLAPFTGLVELDIRGVHVCHESFRAFVLGNPKLEILALQSLVHASWHEKSFPSEPISMNALRSLTLDWEPGSSMAMNVHKHVFAHILAPNLESLEVSPDGRVVNVGNILPVASSLTRLRRLKLVGFARSAGDQISRWFKDLPSDSVEEIHLTDTSGGFLGIDSLVPVGNWRHRAEDAFLLQNDHNPRTSSPSVSPRTVSKYDMIPSFDSSSLSSSCPSQT